MHAKLETLLGLLGGGRGGFSKKKEGVYTFKSVANSSFKWHCLILYNTPYTA